MQNPSDPIKTDALNQTAASQASPTNAGMSRRQMVGASLGAGIGAGLAAGWSLLAAPAKAKAESRLNPVSGWQHELSQHRIVRVEHTRVRLHWPRLVGKNARLGEHGHGPTEPMVILTTNKGAMGWGVGWLGDKPDDRAAELLNGLVGKPLTDLYDFETGIKPACPGVLDVAMHDLVGNALGQPVYALLNPALVGQRAPSTPCYSGMVYFDDLDPNNYPEHSPRGIDRVVANALADYQLGYNQMKIKIGRGNKWMPKDEGMARDIEVTKALQQALPDVTWLVDANDGYSLDDTKRYLDGIADVPLLWFEEPFRENKNDCLALKKFMKEQGRQTHMADGEHNPNQEELTMLMEAGALDVYLTDIIGLGFTRWRQKMKQLIDLGVLASPHAFGSQLKTYYTAHLAAALGNTVTIEGVPCRSDDIDWNGYALSMDGQLAPPMKSGFGMRLTSRQ